MRQVTFAEAQQNCVNCHENPHAEQFGERARKCESCHNSAKWRPSLFDHEETGFALKGGHEDVACSACHTLRRQVEGNEVLFYKPTPKNCDACHGASIPKPKVSGDKPEKGSSGEVR
jgi:hypothetical protein